MIICVTGANGHVGVNLCEQLLDRGHNVRAFIHLHDSALEGIAVGKYSGDLMNKNDIIPFIKGADIVFHLAARISITGDSTGDVYNLNEDGTRNIVDAARQEGVKKFIHFSSIHAFNQLPLNKILDENRELTGEEGFAYDRSKAAGERIVMKAAAEGFDALVLCPTAIIGPRDPEPGLMGQAFLQIYHGKIPALVPGGYDMVDVRDIVDAAINAIEKGKKGEKYLLSNRWHSIKEVSRWISEFTGRKTVMTEMPFWVASAGLPFITMYSRITGNTPLYTSESLQILRHAHRNISNEKARKELGFAPRPVKDSVRDVFDWYRTNNYLKN